MGFSTTMHLLNRLRVSEHRCNPNPNPKLTLTLTLTLTFNDCVNQGELFLAMKKQLPYFLFVAQFSCTTSFAISLTRSFTTLYEVFLR